MYIYLYINTTHRPVNPVQPDGNATCAKGCRWDPFTCTEEPCYCVPRVRNAEPSSKT